MSEKTVPAAGRFIVSRRAMLAGTGVLAAGLAVGLPCRRPPHSRPLAPPRRLPITSPP